MATREEAYRHIREDRLPELRTRLERFTSGKMHISERIGEGPEKDITDEYVAYLRDVIADFEAALTMHSTVDPA
jgi:hypothetical protein